jgi:hypothetical protein
MMWNLKQQLIDNKKRIIHLYFQIKNLPFIKILKSLKIIYNLLVNLNHNHHYHYCNNINSSRNLKVKIIIHVLLKTKIHLTYLKCKGSIHKSPNQIVFIKWFLKCLNHQKSLIRVILNKRGFILQNKIFLRKMKSILKKMTLKI